MQLRELQKNSSKTETEAVGFSKWGVLIVGDSIIESFHVKAMISQKFFVLNHGVGGDSIENIALRYRELVKNTPHKIVIVEGGINDIICTIVGQGEKERTYNDIIDSYSEIINFAKNNNVKPVCLEILPVTNKFLLPFTKSISLPTKFDVQQVNDMVRKVNKGLKELCEMNSIQLFATYDAVVTKQGKASRNFIHADGYHVNIFGYAKMAAIINFKLDQLVESRRDPAMR